MPVRTALRPGVQSPTLPVPKSIPRPEYAWKSTVQEGSEPWVQTPEVIEKMRVAGQIAAAALAGALAMTACSGGGAGHLQVLDDLGNVPVGASDGVGLSRSQRLGSGDSVCLLVLHLARQAGPCNRDTTS